MYILNINSIIIYYSQKGLYNFNILGIGILSIAFVLFYSGLYLLGYILCPNNYIDVLKNSHFDIPKCKFAFVRALNTCSK